ncbi:MAG: MerR family transcriptional regulator [Thermoleophilia bacterium]
MESPSSGYLRIGELSRRVGVSPELLRAWERRYGLLQPARTAGGFRLYSDRDVARVRTMVEQLARGLSAAQAAEIALGNGDGEALRAATVLPAADVEGSRAELLAAIDAFDDSAAQAVLDRVLGGLSIEAVVDDVLLPLLREVGARWERGELTVAQEHFASNLVRGRLLGLARGWGRGVGPLAILACPPGEQHDLPLICLGLGLRGFGWRIMFLGADTPVDTIVEAAAELEPAVVVLSAAVEEAFERAAPALASLGPVVRVALAGPGATPELALRAGAELLRGGPVEAAAALAGSGGD